MWTCHKLSYGRSFNPPEPTHARRSTPEPSRMWEPHGLRGRGEGLERADEATREEWCWWPTLRVKFIRMGASRHAIAWSCGDVGWQECKLFSHGRRRMRSWWPTRLSVATLELHLKLHTNPNKTRGQRSPKSLLILIYIDMILFLLPKCVVRQRLVEYVCTLPCFKDGVASFVDRNVFKVK